MSGLETVTATQIKSIFNDQFDVTASCPSGKKALGGGFLVGTYTGGVADWLISGNGPNVTSSVPADNLSGWRVMAVRGGNPADQIVKAYAVCATVE